MTDFPSFTNSSTGPSRKHGDTLTVPPSARVEYDAKGARRYKWSESTIITNAFRLTTSSNLLAVVVWFPIGDTRASGFHLLNPRVLAGTASAAEVKRHRVMNKISLGILSDLVAMVTDLPMSGALLNRLFPPKDSTDSSLVGTRVNVHLVDEPDTRPGAEPGARRTVVSKYEAINEGAPS